MGTGTDYLQGDLELSAVLIFILSDAESRGRDENLAAFILRIVASIETN